MTDSCVNASANTTIWRQAWLSSARWDCLWIIGPAFISSALVLAFQSQITASPDLPLWAWVSFVLFVDVAHVYATLFRTYLDKQAFERNSMLLTVIPLLCWVGGALLYSAGALVFWRSLAYLAVFHFVRQQYGFMVLYSRGEPTEYRKFGKLDLAVIYMATLYPLLFWHTHLPRNFSWFVDGDFIHSMPAVVAQGGLFIYLAAVAAYVCKELYVYKRTGFFNVPKNLLCVGTALSWWSGIVAINSDLSFTITNVVSHGIPYMALVWLYQRPEPSGGRRQATGSVAVAAGDTVGTTLDRFKSFALHWVPIFVLFLIFLAYLEEGLWDGFVWREHASVFGMFWHLPAITDAGLLALLVPLLSLPQSTHYVLDGFIWRVKDRSSIWSA